MKLTFVLVFGALLLASGAQAAEQPLVFDVKDPYAAVDRQEELQRFLDRAAIVGKDVRLPPGHFRHSGFLVLKGIKLSGSGAQTVLEGTTRDRSAVILSGDGPGLSHVKVYFSSTTRSLDIHASQVLVQKAKDFHVSDIEIEGGDCAGILMDQSEQGTIANNTIRNTLADAIHMTNGTAHVVIRGNLSQYSGDDGVAVVSYVRDGRLSHDIEAFHNVILDNKVARGMAVVGGRDVYYHDNLIRCTGDWAGLYVASEKAHDTYGSSNVRMSDNLIKGCGGKSLGHGAIHVAADAYPNSNILFDGNVASDSKWLGLHLIGNNTGVVFRNNVLLRTKGNTIQREPGAPSFDDINTTVLP